jgi:predicted transcriptional regulator
MVAPSYAAARSSLAKQMGLGRKPADAPDDGKSPAKRGRKPKAT